MKRCLRYLIAIVCLTMALPTFALHNDPLNASSSLTSLDELKKRIKNNDDTVDATIAELGYFFDVNPNAFEQARFLNLKSYKHILEQDLIAGYETLLEARKFAKASSNTIALAESFRLEGLILDFSGEHARALAAMNTALEAFNEVNSDRALHVYSAMGNVYMSLQNFEMLLAMGQSYLATAQRLGNQESKGVAYFYQGYAQSELGNNQDAKVSLLLAEEIFKEVNYPFIGIVYTKMAELHIAQENLTEALTMLNRAAESDRKVGFKYNEGSKLLLLADIYVMRGEVDLAISELEAGLEKDTVKNDKAVVLNLLEKLISLLETANKWQAALDYSKLYKTTYEESFNEQQSRLLALNRVRLAISEKEETIKLLEKDNQLKEQQNLIQKKQNTFQLYFIVFVILSLGLVIGLWLRTRKQRKTLDDLTQDLQRATKAKSDFLARMSHEIRTPLNAIIGLTKLSQRAAEDKDQQTNLIQIEGASQTLLSIINDILDFSKIEAGKLDIESTQFNLDHLVNQTIRLHLGRAEEKHIELIQHISREVPLNLIGDPLRIQQVLSNLVSNALKFTEDGLISVSVRCNRNADNIQLEFEVKDSGIGLSSTQKALLFQPFNQGDESISRRYGGTGLGLAICKQLVTLMGGEIWVESQLGKGASFHFTVVVNEDPSQQIVSPSKQLSSLKVLIADDISVSRDAICESLSVANIQADIATGGKQAVAKMRSAAGNSSPYDVLILDWNMPDIDGLEVVAIMNQELLIKQPKVIMLYAFESPHMREQAKQLGIQTFIKKPFSTSELVDKLQELCLNVNTKSSTAEAAPVPNLRGTKILFAEDNTLNQKVTLGLLNDTHATIKVVNNGLEALNTLRKDNSYDVVLMDIQMPVMDGLTAAKSIREELRLTLPIIAMTAHAMQQDIDKSIKAGMDGHINKPVDPNRFFDVLVEVLNKGKTATSAVVNPQLSATMPLTFIDKPKAMQTLLNDEALYNELLSDFVALEDELSTLRKAIDEKDYPTIVRITHIYTTSLKYIGANALAELTSSIELTIKHNQHDAMDDFNKKLAAMFEALTEINAKVEGLLKSCS
ncbi:response regulator [Alteromonas gracilis]|uniref:tetratricopeptide repeat-containing hybrid sensor histidine kinase/response regulator n=1 Tax=Alteromonas gracilis TaxID=1479524 RepID=UPI0037365AAF